LYSLSTKIIIAPQNPTRREERADNQERQTEVKKVWVDSSVTPPPQARRGANALTRAPPYNCSMTDNAIFPTLQRVE